MAGNVFQYHELQHGDLKSNSVTEREFPLKIYPEFLNIFVAVP